MRLGDSPNHRIRNKQESTSSWLYQRTENAFPRCARCFLSNRGSLFSLSTDLECGKNVGVEMSLYQNVARPRPIRAVRGKVRNIIILSLLLLVVLHPNEQKQKKHLNRSVYHCRVYEICEVS